MAQAKTKKTVKAAPKPVEAKKEGFFAKLFGSADKKLAEKSQSCCCNGCCSDKPKAPAKKKK